MRCERTNRIASRYSSIIARAVAEMTKITKLTKLLGSTWTPMIIRTLTVLVGLMLVLADSTCGPCKVNPFPIASSYG
jgi:hypothetical protein